MPGDIVDGICTWSTQCRKKLIYLCGICTFFP